MLGGNKQYSKHVGNHFNDSNIQAWMGLADEGEADNYTRHVVCSGASTGSSRSAKRNSAGDPLPARVLKPEHFDHNGMMARNLLSIASTGQPDPAWIAAAKKVAAGANYLSEFPANLGDTYALGSRGVHPTMGSTTPTPTPPPAPAVTPTPAPAPTLAPAPTPVVEEEVEETPEETVVEETVETKAPVGTTYLGNDEAITMNQPTSDPRPSGRSLNDATWAARDASMGGMYPYDTSRAPLKIVFSQHPSNANLQPPVTAKNVVLDLFGDSEDVSVTEVDASPDMFIIIIDGNAYVSVGGQQYVYAGNDLDVRVAWKRGSDEITGVVVKDGGTELIRISDRKLMVLGDQAYLDTTDVGTLLRFNDAPANFWVAPEVLYDVSDIDPFRLYTRDPSVTRPTVSEHLHPLATITTLLSTNSVIRDSVSVTTLPRTFRSWDRSPFTRRVFRIPLATFVRRTTGCPASSLTPPIRWTSPRLTSPSTWCSTWTLLPPPIFSTAVPKRLRWKP